MACAFVSSQRCHQQLPFPREQQLLQADLEGGHAGGGGQQLRRLPQEGLEAPWVRRQQGAGGKHVQGVQLAARLQHLAHEAAGDT